MSKTKKEAELDNFFNFLVLVTEELNFSECHNVMLEEIKYMSGMYDVKHFGPYADHWYGGLENYSEAYLEAKNVSRYSLAKAAEITEIIFDSWCEPKPNQMQNFIDEMKAIPIVDFFYKSYEDQ